MSEQKHPFWKAISGELPVPPAARLLGWKPLEAVPGSGRFRVQFDGSEQFTNPQGNIVLIGEGRVVHRGGSIAFLEGNLSNSSGEVVATATSTARIVRMQQ